VQSKVFMAIQIIAGLLLVLFGLNGFFGFLAMPKPSLQLGSWEYAVFQTGYLFPLISAIEILAGISFVLNKFVSLMAIVLLPVMLNALLGHLFLNDVSGMVPALFEVLIIIAVMIKNKNRYGEILKA